MTLLEQPNAEDIGLRSNDACTLRKRNLSPAGRGAIIASHVNKIVGSINKQKHWEWSEGEVPPKAFFVVSYINETYRPAFRGRSVLAENQAYDLYKTYLGKEKNGEIPRGSSIAFFTLSSVAFAADCVAGDLDPGGLQAYEIVIEQQG